MTLAEGDRLIGLLHQLGFTLWHPQLASLDENGVPLVLAGIEDFRQHLGGALCITLVAQRGRGEEVNHINQPAMIEALTWLEANFNEC
jgi:3-dehydroquinate synthase